MSDNPIAFLTSCCTNNSLWIYVQIGHEDSDFHLYLLYTVCNALCVHVHFYHMPYFGVIFPFHFAFSCGILNVIPHRFAFVCCALFNSVGAAAAAVTARAV